MYPQRLVTSALAAAAALYPWSSAGAQEPPEVWSLQEDLRTGSVDDGPYALVSIRALAISPRTGSIFLGLGPDEIRVFSAEGEYLRNISRAGEGPGELVGLAGLGWQDDFLVVLNTSRRGSSAYTFTEEGDLVASATLELPRPDDFPAAADGSAIGVLSGERYLWRFSNDWFRLEPGTRNAAPLYLLGSDGGAQRLDLLDGPRTWRIERATGRQPLARTSHVAADPDGQSIVIAHQYPTVGTGNPQFRIRRLAADGTVLYARNYRYTPGSATRVSGQHHRCPGRSDHYRARRIGSVALATTRASGTRAFPSPDRACRRDRRLGMAEAGSTSRG